jgi:hypothetical protein
MKTITTRKLPLLLYREKKEFEEEVAGDQERRDHNKPNNKVINLISFR